MKFQYDFFQDLVIIIRYEERKKRIDFHLIKRGQNLWTSIDNNDKYLTQIMYENNVNCDDFF